MVCGSNDGAYFGHDCGLSCWYKLLELMTCSSCRWCCFRLRKSIETKIRAREEGERIYLRLRVETVEIEKAKLTECSRACPISRDDVILVCFRKRAGELG